MKAECTNSECGRPSHARGMCKNHYELARAREQRRLNPAVKLCADCGTEFNPRGPQERCTACRTKVCPSCGTSFLTNKRNRSHCSRRCVGSDPVNVARLSDSAFPRGVKPRTWLKTHPDAQGSAEQREWRRAILERDDYTCQLCGARDCPLEADHIQPFSTHPELRFVMENGRTLCVPCHIATPTHGWRLYWLNKRIAARRLDQGVLDFGSAS